MTIYQELLPVLFLFISIVFSIIIGFRDYKKSIRLLQVGVPVTGKVIELISNFDSKNGTQYKPKIEYLDPFGVNRIYISNVSTNPPAYTLGQTINLLYDPQKENEIRIHNFWGLYRLAIFCGMASIGFLAGILIIVFHSK